MHLIILIITYLIDFPRFDWLIACAIKFRIGWTSNRRANMHIMSTKKYVIKSLHGDIFLGYDFIFRFGKFIALGFASCDKFASLNINSYPNNSNHVTDSIAYLSLCICNLKAQAKKFMKGD